MTNRKLPPKRLPTRGDASRAVEGSSAIRHTRAGADDTHALEVEEWMDFGDEDVHILRRNGAVWITQG